MNAASSFVSNIYSLLHLNPIVRALSHLFHNNQIICKIGYDFKHIDSSIRIAPQYFQDLIWFHFPEPLRYFKEGNRRNYPPKIKIMICFGFQVKHPPSVFRVLISARLVPTEKLWALP